MRWIDTHCHLDGEEFAEDRDAVIERARQAGVAAVLVPAIDLQSSERIQQLCQQYPGYCYPMVGLHPEEVRSDWREVLLSVKRLVFNVERLVFSDSSLNTHHPSPPPHHPTPITQHPIAIGEVGLDFYWSREFEKEQLAAFEEQVKWSVETRLPLMVHCRKAQNEMVRLLRHYERELPGGVFHCFTGNELEAAELLQFDRFVLGVGGVLTFKKSHLPEVLPHAVPLDRIVLETDAPYMAPAPMRGQRNEPAFTRFILARMAEAYGVSEDELAEQTNANVARVFGVSIA